MSETDKTALLVMDVQPGIVDRLEDPEAYLASVNTVIEAAHARQLPVIYVVVGFRTGLPEVSRRNRSFSAIKESGAERMVNPSPAIEPAAGDVVVTKRRVSAFTGSDLEVVLRAHDIRHLVLTGIATSGVVLSTVREAADKDYQLTVLSDLSADLDDEVQRVLTEKVFPRQAEVITAKEWLNQ
ncbi:MAG TPA: isochorismatase family cysteine hydrolase, partial [Candidatus Saccharimonadales bacterium]|nr:isochorismatase family cysteine hydrolase [Candidatus Saccharimonadales bacterium]